MKRDRVTISGGALRRILLSAACVACMAAPLAAQPAGQPAKPPAEPQPTVSAADRAVLAEISRAYRIHDYAYSHCEKADTERALQDLQALRDRIKRNHDLTVRAGEFAATDVRVSEGMLFLVEQYLKMASRRVVTKDCVRQLAYGEMPPRDPYEGRFPRASAPPPPAAEPDPLEAGRAAVDAGMAPAPRAIPAAADLAGTWVVSGYYCDGPQGDEIVSIRTSGSGGLVATKVTGDTCIPAGVVTWKGTLQGTSITGQFHIGDIDGSNRRWVDGSWTVISRDEIRGENMTLRRGGQ